MPLDDIGPDDEPSEIEEALRSFQESLPEQFRTEFEGDYETAGNFALTLSSLDEKISRRERERIARLNIDLVPGSKICPYLKQTPSCESHYSCIRTEKRCTIERLGDLCVGNFRDCNSLKSD